MTSLLTTRRALYGKRSAPRARQEMRNLGEGLAGSRAACLGPRLGRIVAIEGERRVLTAEGVVLHRRYELDFANNRRFDRGGSGPYATTRAESLGGD